MAFHPARDVNDWISGDRDCRLWIYCDSDFDPMQVSLIITIFNHATQSSSYTGIIQDLSAKLL